MKILLIGNKGQVGQEIQEQAKLENIPIIGCDISELDITGLAAFMQTNVLSTFTLLEAARKHQCYFHHISTDEVYGELGREDLPFTESSPYNPSSPYSASKAATISNCSNNYSPYQHAEKLIPIVIRCCLAQKPIPVYGNGSNIRDWLYVEDHCSAIDAILNKGESGETHNIGGNCKQDNLSLIKTICQIMDQTQPMHNKYENLITFVKDRPGHDWKYAIDGSKIKNELNWKPRFKLDDGLRSTIKHYLEYNTL